MKLGPGRYWLNVLANTAQSRGFWYWSINSVRRGEPAAMWNFGGGWGLCTDTWHPLATCLSDDSYQDLRFKLVGRER